MPSWKCLACGKKHYAASHTKSVCPWCKERKLLEKGPEQANMSKCRKLPDMTRIWWKN